MLAKICFTQRASGLSCTVEIELNEQRCPKAVRNFLYCARADTLSEEDKCELMKNQQQPGLPPPLVNSNVRRVDVKDGTIEFGTSASKSVFGGFFEDENLDTTEVSEYDRGAVVMSNVGPNSNASHFILLLAPQPSLKGIHSCIGFVRSGLDGLEHIVTKTKVRPHSLEPMQAITIESVVLERRAPPTLRERRPRTARGIRGREDDDEDPRAAAEEQDAPTTTTVSSSSSERILKKRRGETVIVREDGTEEIVTTALPPSSLATGSGKDGSDVQQPFDLFDAQQYAFSNDLLQITDVQTQRKHNRENRKSRAVSFSPHHSNSGGNKKKGFGSSHSKPSGGGKRTKGLRY